MSLVNLFENHLKFRSDISLIIVIAKVGLDGATFFNLKVKSNALWLFSFHALLLSTILAKITLTTKFTLAKNL